MRMKLPIAAGIAVALAAGFGLYSLGVMQGQRSGGSMSSGETLRPGDIDPSTGRRILYWHDPMVPAQRFDAPGKSPFMDMQLVPVYADAGEEGTVTISPRVQQNIGIRTADVVREQVAAQIRAAGNVAFNERAQVLVQARAAGYIERLRVRARYDRVAAGQPLADVYIPDWVAAQQEYLSVLRWRGTDLASLVDAAANRMRQAGMTEEQIRRIEQSGAVEPRVTLAAPIAGVVTELAAREGMTVEMGSPLFTLNGIDTVWVDAAVPARESGLLRPTTAVTARTAALPGRTWTGTVQTILPAVDVETRTVAARVELANPDSALLPGMYVDLELAGAPLEALTIPTEALIRTGQRTIAIVAEANGAFRPAEVVVGNEFGDRTEIRSGLEAGQRVVASGQFLIDSEASLRSAIDRLTAPLAEPAR
jgi:membrane fusion protein, copper/silver efflux system